jgi:hypothetical protein
MLARVWRCVTRSRCHRGNVSGLTPDLVFVEDAAEAVVSLDVQMSEPRRNGDWWRQWA